MTHLERKKKKYKSRNENLIIFIKFVLRKYISFSGRLAFKLLEEPYLEGIGPDEKKTVPATAKTGRIRRFFNALCFCPKR